MARGLTSGEQADPGDDGIPARRRLQQGMRRTDALEGRGAIRNFDAGQARVQTDQHRVGPQPQRIADPVDAQRQIHGAVRVDGPLQRRGVIGVAITHGAELARIGPVRDRRQWPHGGRARRRQMIDRRQILRSRKVSDLAQARHGKPIAEGAHAIAAALACNAVSAVPQVHEHRCIAGQGVVEPHLRVDRALIGNHDTGLSHPFKAHILAPQRIAITGVDFDANRYIAQCYVDQRQAGLMFANRRARLALEARIQHGELPGRRGLLGHDAIASAQEAQVLDEVAGLVDAGKSASETEIHVAEVGMLRNPEADRGRRRVAGPDLDVDVAHHRIERAGIRVRDLRIEGHVRRRRKWYPRFAGARPRAHRIAKSGTREDHHAADTALEARGVAAQDQDRTLRADTVQPHTGCDEQRVADPIAPGRQEDHATRRVFRRRIQPVLDRIRVIGAPVALA